MVTGHGKCIWGWLSVLTVVCPDTNLHGNSTPGFPFFFFNKNIIQIWPSCVCLGCSLLACSIYELDSSNKIQIRSEKCRRGILYLWITRNFSEAPRKVASAWNIEQVFPAFLPLLTQSNCRVCFSSSPNFWKREEKGKRLESIAFHWITFSTESWVMLVKKNRAEVSTSLMPVSQ